MGSFYVSGKLPTYPSTKPTVTLSSYLGQNVGLRKGWGKCFTETKNDPRYVRNREREIDAHVVLSGSYNEVGDYHELNVECGKRALSIAKEVGNRKRKAEACAVLAWPNTA